MNLHRITHENRGRVNTFIREHWYTTDMILRGQVVDMTGVDGLIAQDADDIIGLITFIRYDGTLEITSLDSLREHQGIGTALLDAVIAIARESGVTRIVLITTNDNLNAMRFYQKRGFDMANLYRNAMDVSRRLKPEIPLIGEDDIPLRHEIEFELLL